MNTLSYSITKTDLLKYRRKLRRQREIRRRAVLFVLTLFCTVILALSYNVIISQANDEMTDVTYKYFTSYEVTKGDTLWSIAEENINYDFYDHIQEYVDEVIEINHLHGDKIRVGQNIIVPYFSKEYY